MPSPLTRLRLILALALAVPVALAAPGCSEGEVSKVDTKSAMEKGIGAPKNAKESRALTEETAKHPKLQ